MDESQKHGIRWNKTISEQQKKICRQNDSIYIKIKTKENLISTTAPQEIRPSIWPLYLEDMQKTLGVIQLTYVIFLALGR